LNGPIGKGDLWDHLVTCQPRDRLIILASAKLLRDSEVRLSRGLSWERTVEHLLGELRQSPAIRALNQARHLIVNFEADGALWINISSPNEPRACLVFDAEHAEGEWGSSIKGEAFGYQSCLAAAVIQTLVSHKNNQTDPDFQPAMERGLSAMRNLREEGHGNVDRNERGFPCARLAAELVHPKHRFSRALIPSSILDRRTTQTSAPWSILASLQNPAAPQRPLYGFARQLAIQGQAVLAHVPHLRVRELVTADRGEMETLRSLRRIMIAYRDSDPGKKPLSIGVFGAPGSGKSFGVEQLAVGIFGDAGGKSYKGSMEFNLSQFDSPSDLIGAFHQVRDRVLQGLIPVAFLDEFDSREYFWLQYLLAPMQDGRFQEGQITHALGKCVFIFAGGTSDTFEEFGSQRRADEKNERFKLAKGPDFKSRLDGYLNVLGPNQRKLGASWEKKRAADPSDIFFPVRRALMIRNALDCKKDETLDIDPGLLTALLRTGEYRHGARSVKKILEPFNIARTASRGRLQRWQAPAPNQLSLHVNTEEFHSMCAQDYSFKTDEIVHKLAPAIHEAWREIARLEGWKPRYDMPYDELPPDMKRSNEAAARRIPEIIALVGLQVVPGIATKREENEIREHIERHLEALAEEEHKGWMAHLYSEAWRLACFIWLSSPLTGLSRGTAG